VASKAAARARARRDRTEDGTGLIGSTAGILVFVVFMLLAVQVLFDLYARSAVTSASFDAARVVAGADAGATPAAEADAEDAARRVLGHYGARARFRWTVDSDTVALTVHLRNPSLLPAVFSRPLSLDTIDRTVRVHRERL
jgi:hypothetical protein